MNEPTDWNDRMMDRALHELHGEAPPDLLHGVLQRLHEPPRAPTPRRAPVARIVLAALAGTAAAALAFVAFRPAATGIDVVHLDLAVLRGEVQCAEAHGPAPATSAVTVLLRAGERHEFAARRGNRLLCGLDLARPGVVAMPEAASSALAIGPFGLLATTPHTELEVSNMEWTWKNGTIATGALTLAVVAGTATWQLLGRSESAVAGQTLRLETQAEADLRVKVQTENEQLRKQNAELQQRLEAMAAQLARTPAAEPPPPAPTVATPPEAAPAEAPPAELVFGDPAFADALRAIDWKTIGEVTNEMAPKLVELLQALDKEGAEMPTDLAILISKLNQKLLDQVPALLKTDLPGFGPNGVYTHPLVVANSLASTLAAAGQGLTPAQQGAIAALTRGFTGENAALAGQQHEFDLEALASETDMKDRMYEQLAQTLTPEQRAVMFPPGAQQHDGGSLFSTGLLWSLHGEGVPATNPADFARVASRKLESQLELDEASAARVRQVLERAAANAPELFADRGTTLEISTGRMLKSGRAKQALQRQLAWMREIQRTVPLTSEQRQKLANWRRVLVPLPR